MNGTFCLDRIPAIIRECNEKIHALLEDGRYRFDCLDSNLFTYDQTNLILRNLTDDDILDDMVLEQKFDFNFTQSDVKDRIEIINDFITGKCD